MVRNRGKVCQQKGSEKEVTILVCDPSFTAWGWALVSLDGKIIDTGCIKTSPSNKKLKIRKGDDKCRRVSEINQILLSLIEKYNVCFILSEQPHGSQSAVAAVTIGICIGIIQTLADTFHIGVEWVLEGDAKKCLLGRRSASKNAIIEAIKAQYDVSFTGTKYIDEAVADALAVYHYGVQNSNVFRIIKG